ncbi:hypothetical protein [Thioclava sp.]|uniref:hypothetical protein n=1 Tax=Thioclava sp. TaxID=1933450 RepID=UPI003AA7AF30
MATYEAIGYFGGDFVVEGAGNILFVGSRVMLDPGWDASTDARKFTLSDNDNTLNGDTCNDEVGDDSDQSATVEDAQGNAIASGQAYSEAYFTFSAPDGTVVYANVIEIGGTIDGVVTSEPIQPGGDLQRL